MGKQESSVIKVALENIIEFISDTIEDLFEKAMFMDSKTTGEFLEENDGETLLLQERIKEINELGEEFIQLARDINTQEMTEEMKKEKLEEFLEEKKELTKRYRHF